MKIFKVSFDKSLSPLKLTVSPSHPMENKITSSVFRSKGIYTVVEKPSSLVHVLLNGISIEPPEKLIDSIAYYHKDIGTIEDMNQLFTNLEKESLNR